MKPLKCFLFITITLFLFSCKKDKKKDCTLTEANFAGSYKVATVKYKQTASSPEVDGKSIFFDNVCEQDDYTTFKTDHTYTYTDAGTKCDPEGSYSGTWSLNGNTLITDADSQPVQDFSCSGFTSGESNVLTAGDSVIVTFAKQ